MTQFADIADAVVALMQAAPALSSNVWKGRRRPVPEQAADAVIVRLRKSELDHVLQGNFTGAPTQWVTNLEVELYARPSSTQTADEVLDSLLSDVGYRIAADSTLTGSVADIRIIEIDWDDEEAADRLVSCVARCQVKHQTSNRTLE